jgi:HlyD family secretion protein
MKYVIWLVILAALVGGGYAYFYSREKTAAAAVVPPQTEKVTRRTVQKEITANGKVASNRDVDIKCQASGKVVKLPYDISDHVTIGDVLLELDPVDQARSVDQAEAQFKASQARLEQAKLNLRVAEMNLPTTTSRVQAEFESVKAKAADAKAKAQRTQELYNDKLASKEELETAQTTATQAEANVASAQAALDELEQQKISLEVKRQDIKTAEAQVAQDDAKLKLAKLQLSYTQVRVPEDEASKTADYRVAALSVQLGSIVQSGSSGFSGGTSVMTLSDVSHMFVLASVDESDIGQVADPSRGGDKQKARITVDAYPGVEFDGEVVRVATKGVNTSNVVTFEVKIEVTSPNKSLLRPEMTATARLIIASRPDVLSIPAGAFSRNPPGDTGAPRAADAAAPGTAPATEPAAADAAQPQQVAGGRGPGGGGRGGGGGGGGGGGRAGAGARGAQMDGYAQVVKDDNSIEVRPITVGLSDDTSYEVIKGLDEGESVVVNRVGSDSRWRNQTQTNLMPRGLGGGGRGR